MNLQERCASDLMTTPVVSVARDDTLRTAARTMTTAHLHALLVIREPGQVPGLITTKDIVQAVADGDDAALDILRVVDVMSAPAITVSARMRIPDCIGLMRMTGVRVAPVVEGDQILGVLSYTDIARAAAM
jgi:CBS domain-containing protein